MAKPPIRTWRPVTDLTDYRTKQEQKTLRERGYVSYAEPGTGSAATETEPDVQATVSSIPGSSVLDRRNFAAIDDILEVRIVDSQVFVTIRLNERDERGQTLVRPTDEWLTSLACVITQQDLDWSLNVSVMQVIQEDHYDDTPHCSYVTLVSHYAPYGRKTILELAGKNAKFALVAMSGLPLEAVRPLEALLGDKP